MIQKGDIVQVRPDLKRWKTYDGIIYTNSMMADFAGQKAIVTEVFILNDEIDVICYRLQFLNEYLKSHWCWSESMLLLVNSKLSIF